MTTQSTDAALIDLAARCEAAKAADDARAANDTYVRPMTALEASCTICFGSGIWGGEHAYPCHCRTQPEAQLVRKVLMELTVAQMTFLRRFEHTLAEQPVTGAEWDECPSFYVEDDDAVIEGYDIVWPATKHWFAGGRASMGPQHDGVRMWVKYNPLGLALRECLMAGADARCR